MDMNATSFGGIHERCREDLCAMLIVSLRLWLVAGAIGLAVVGGLALVTGHLSKIAIETGLISAIIVFVFLLGSTGPSAGLETAVSSAA